MAKQKLTLAINKNILKKTKDLKINISSFLEVRLVDFLTKMEECGRRDLNPSYKLGKLK